MGYDRGDSFHFDFLNQMEFKLVQKIEKKTVTTIIFHSIWREREIYFSDRFSTCVRGRRFNLWSMDIAGYLWPPFYGVLTIKYTILFIDYKYVQAFHCCCLNICLNTYVYANINNRIYIRYYNLLIVWFTRHFQTNSSRI